MRISIGVCRKSHPLQRPAPLREPGLALHRLQAKRDIFEDGHMREQRKVLKHQADAPRFWRDHGGRARHLATINQNPALVWPLKPGDQSQQRGLAAA